MSAEDLARDVAAEVATPGPDVERPEFERRQAYVTSIAADRKTVGVKFPESSTEISGVRPLHDLPAVNDTIWVDKVGPDLVVSSAGHGLPVGAILMWALATPPPNWAFCQGQGTGGGAFPRLAEIGLSAIPDLRDRFVRGSGVATLGATGGAVQVNLTAGNLPSHSHSLPNHSHGIGPHKHALGPTDNPGGLDDQGFPPNNVHKSIRTSDRGVYGRTHGSTNEFMDGVGLTTDPGGSGSAGNTGTGDPVATLPPFYVLAFIIKVA